MTARSPFLDIDPREWTASNELAFCIRDRYPVSRGHTLVIPKRVVATWFDATREEQHALMQLHVHVVPMFIGDMDGPRGGVRCVIPGRRNARPQPWQVAQGAPNHRRK